MAGTNSDITGEQFTAWLAEMKAAKLADSDAQCGRLLGLSTDSMWKMKTKGCDRRTALACRALLHRLAPYPFHG